LKTNIIRAALFTPGPPVPGDIGPDGERLITWGIPVMLWGLPGVAKSAIFRMLARSFALPIEVLSPGARGEGAFGVTPVPEREGVDHKGKPYRMTYPRPDWTDKFSEGRGIVLVDEINLAATHYAGALLGMLQDRVVGSHHLGPGVRVFAAANPVDIAAASGGFDLSAPAANRVGHLEWPCPSVEEWSAWLMGAEVEPEVYDAVAFEAEVLEQWPAAWATARGIVAGFLSSNASRLHMMPKDGSATMSKAWASPRSWEMATRALAGAEIHGLEADRDEFVGSFVGAGAAGELFSWLDKARLPNSADLLDGKISWKHKVARLDVTTAVFSSAVGTCIATKDEALRKKRGVVMWELLAQATETAPDLTITPIKTLVHAKVIAPATVKVSKLLGPLTAALNMNGGDAA
jgi:MoxR-like ATPase